MWWYRKFKILSSKEALDLNLNWSYNIKSDGVIHHSIWIDKKGKKYKVNNHFDVVGSDI